MDTHAALRLCLVFLFAAVAAVPIFRRLGLGSVLAYLFVGVCLGPFGLRVVSDTQATLSFAELGVVMLLFIIGLELKPSRLWVMRRAVFGLGAAQVVITGTILAVAAHFFGLTWTTAIVAGIGLSLSSTPFTLQLLAEKNQLNTSHGRGSFAILLFQDLAVIPLLAVVPMLGGSESSSQSLLLSGARAAGVIALIVVSGRYLLPYAFRIVASARLKEVFVAAALLLVVGTAALMESVGLSMALGSFLAGVLLADSEYRHELEADIDPFKGLLMGLFFMAVGMSVDLRLLLARPGLILGLTVALMAVKWGALYAIGRVAGFTEQASRCLASVLPQGGEFAFVLFSVATVNRVMPQDVANVLVLVVTLSMALTPLFLAFNDKVLSRHRKRTAPTFDSVPDRNNPVLIGGFGRFGQIAGRVLRMKGIGFTALEHSPEQVEVLRKFGNEIYYGDASRLDLLETGGAHHAKVFVLAIDDIEASLRTARMVREHFPHLKIFARARNRHHVFELMKLGVTNIQRETFGSSLEMAENLLVELGSEREKAKVAVARFREHDEKMLLGQYKVYENEAEMINFSRQAAQQLTEVMRADESTS